METIGRVQGVFGAGALFFLLLGYPEWKFPAVRTEPRFCKTAFLNGADQG